MDVLGDRYELIRCIGRGGYGSVWLARDRKLDREVAVKRIDVSDRRRNPEASARRAEREAIATAKLDHPNIVRIHDVGRLDDNAEVYLVMELLDGHTLHEELVEHGPLAPERASALVTSALRALDAAHRSGVVHKDLKPANLFLESPGTADETVKVIDFGIARMESLDKLTRTGRMVGSPRYLAPEYVQEHRVTPRVDIYQMGLIFAEALSGVPPVPRGLNSVESCERHIKGNLKFPGTLRNSPYFPVIRRATSLEPTDRYPNASAFADAIEGASRPTQATTETRDNRTQRYPAIAEGAPGPSRKEELRIEEPPPRLAVDAMEESTPAPRRALPYGVAFLIVAVAIGVGIFVPLVLRDAPEPEPTVVHTADAPEPEQAEEPQQTPIERASFDVATAWMAARLESNIAARPEGRTLGFEIVPDQSNHPLNGISKAEWERQQIEMQQRVEREMGIANLPRPTRFGSTNVLFHSGDEPDHEMIQGVLEENGGFDPAAAQKEAANVPTKWKK